MINSLKGNKPQTIGILGGGQLAKMLSLAAYRLGLNIAIIENGLNSPAGMMTKFDFGKGWEDKDELDKFIEVSDIVTLENEFINPDILEYIENKGIKVYPTSSTMRLVQDKYIQKQTFQNAGLPLPIFSDINSIEDLETFSNRYGYPYVLKSRKFGYDGYGNATIYSIEEAKIAYNKFSADSKRSSLMAETFVKFTKEIAVMAVRSENGETTVYPAVESIQKNHICHSVIAPAEIDIEIRKKAQSLALEAVKAIDGVGVFGVEFFLEPNGTLLINEIAPRPHNSGHYTIEACFTSQYENAIRAINGLPLGSTDMITESATMINLLGGKDGNGVPSDVSEILKAGNVWLHLYNKSQCRNGRKMGHINVLGSKQSEDYQYAKSIAEKIIW